jgi:ribosome-binding factor A
MCQPQAEQKASMDNGSRRILRVEREIRELVSTYMVFQLNSEMEGIAAITRVIVSRDLRTAKALVYNQQGEETAAQNVELLQARAPQIQQYINSQIRMKYCPRIKFFVDTKFEEAMRVQEALRQLELERKQNENHAE